MAITKEDVLEFISGLSVLELSELLKNSKKNFKYLHNLLLLLVELLLVKLLLRKLNLM